MRGESVEWYQPYWNLLRRPTGESLFHVYVEPRMSEVPGSARRVCRLDLSLNHSPLRTARKEDSGWRNTFESYCSQAADRGGHVEDFWLLSSDSTRSYRKPRLVFLEAVS